MLNRYSIAWNLTKRRGPSSSPRAAFENKGGPIATTSFNHTGRIFAYAVTNDWSGGHMSNKPDFPNKVFLHPCKDEASFVFSLFCFREFPAQTPRMADIHLDVSRIQEVKKRAKK